MNDPSRGTSSRRLAVLWADAHAWIERQDADSPTGVAVEAWRRYKAVDGPLQTALLSLYILVAVVPALLVMEEYLDANPAALANRIVHHYDLSRTTAGQVRSILSDPRKHELGSALLAIASALVFGLGLGRVLQLVHTRAWQITLPNRGSDRARYAAVLLGLYGLIFALLAQLDVLGDGSSWMDLTALPLWVALLTVFFTWSPRFLTHKRLEWRDLLPSAVLTATGLVTLMVISTYVMERWVDFYARDYGGLGVVMAIFFWIELSAGIIVWTASLSPALVARRRLRADRFASS